MAVSRHQTRRDVIRGLAAVAAAALARPSLAQAAPRIAVIGGGFGGTACARALRRRDAKLQVTLIEPNKTFTACPFSNEVIAGLRELTAAGEARRGRLRHGPGQDRIQAAEFGPALPQ